MRLAGLTSLTPRALALVVTAAGLTRALPGQAPAAPPALVPAPREYAARPFLSLAHGASSTAPGGAADDRFAAAVLDSALRERGVPAGGSVRIVLLRRDAPAARALLASEHLRFEPAMNEEGYVLVTAPGRVTVIGASGAGVFYGAQTVAQLVRGHGPTARLAGARIRDWPALRWRGLHDDLSRGRVPTLEYQKRQVRTMAAYKLNVLSPYFEHTLEYPGEPLPAPPGGALTPADVQELVAYARRYHVQIVPEQEAFGHLHHVLKYEEYATLAETPHGHVLAPDQPGSLPLIGRWFGAIDSLFPGPFIHIGADETFELGRGQTADRVRSEGIGRVYLGFLTRIDSLLHPLGKRLLFWGDVAMNHPDLVRTLPHDLIAVPWVYEPSSRGFDRFITPFSQAGLEFWVAPGVNNWSRVYPDNALALPNIQGFVRDGQRLGATGMLNTDWNDDGEALFAQAWYGVLFGAAAAWQPGESSIERYQSSFGVVFHGDTTGRIDEAQRKLMAAHALLAHAGVGDASDALFWADPWSPEGERVAARIRPVLHDVRLLAEDALVLVAQARAAAPLRESDALDALALGARRMDAIGMKFQFADEMAAAYRRAFAARADSVQRGAVTRDLADISGINGRAQDLRDAYSLTRDLYERAWMRESRPYALRQVLERYDMAAQLWIARGDRFSQLLGAWRRTRQLPAPSDVGLPPQRGDSALTTPPPLPARPAPQTPSP